MKILNSPDGQLAAAKKVDPALNASLKSTWARPINSAGHKKITMARNELIMRRRDRVTLASHNFASHCVVSTTSS